MENNKIQNVIERSLIFTVMFITIFSISKYLGGTMQDSITKSSCNMLDKVYVSSDKLGFGFCIDK